MNTRKPMPRRRNRTPRGYYLLLVIVAAAYVLLGMTIHAVMQEYKAEPEPAQPTHFSEVIRTVSVEKPVEEVIEESVVAEPAREVVAVDPEPSPLPYTEQDLELLALVIYQEAGGDACSDMCRQLVGEVVLNRVADDRYPDSLYEVITQKGQYGRLHWTDVVWPERAAKPQEAHAVERAYDCAEGLLSGSVERLLPEDVVFQSEYIQGSEIVAKVDGIYFCR